MSNLVKLVAALFAVLIISTTAVPAQSDQHVQNESAKRFAVSQSVLPRWAIKTDLLYGSASYTPNLSFEMGVRQRSTFEFTVGYNPWHRNDSGQDDRKWVHLVIKPSFRWWLCERFNGHFFGLDLFFARYNVNRFYAPMLFKREFRYDGIAHGAGITYGYHLMLAKRWGVDFTFGLGFLRLRYNRYDCAPCARANKPIRTTYLGPTSLGINLVFLIK